MWLALWVFVSLWASAARADCPPLSPEDDTPDSCALQALLDRGGEILLKAPATSDSPGYILDRGLRLTVSSTRLIGPAAGNKARILAAPDIADAMLDAHADNFTIAYVVFDGNRENRRHKVASCRGPRSDAYNLILRGASFVVHDLESIHTLCGSAMAVEGRDFRIYNNRIVDNGWDIFDQADIGYALEAWADGMTVWRCDRGQISDNTLGDNTDIDIVVGGGDGCQVLDNRITHSRKYGFGGIHVGWFPNGDGTHTGSLFEGNRIVSEPDRLHFGIMVGLHPWVADIWLADAGRIVNNYVEGAGINLAIDGVLKAEVLSNTLGFTSSDPNLQSCPFGRGVSAPILSPPYIVHNAHAWQGDDLQPGAICMNLDEGKCEPCSAAGPDPQAPPERIRPKVPKRGVPVGR